jgi:1-phosphatidylinositol phosphodiesterase
MASLTIRNLSITPLELKSVDRFEADAVPGPGGFANITANATSTIKGFLNPITRSPKPGLVAKSVDAHDRHDVNLRVDPFTTHATDIRSADPGREVIRLTFEEPDSGGKRYQVDIPGPSPRSLTLTRLNGAEKEYTAVYLPTGAFLTLMSSANLSQWMHEIRDDLPISVLSLPGTHNSPTCHVALPSVRCQAVGVKQQLANGVRYLDIRVNCSADDDDLTLVHSVFPISLTGTKRLDADLFKDVYEFLDNNKTETVLISLKREGPGKGTDDRFGRILHDNGRYLGGDNAKRWFTEPRIPSLGEVRGRVVLVRRFGLEEGLKQENGGKGWGIDASAWPDNCEDAPTGSGLIRVQDFYEITESTNIQKKIDLCRKLLEKSGECKFNGGSPPLYVNFLSASNFFNASCWPERIAAKVNPAMVEYLCMRHGEDHKGPNGLSCGDCATGIVVTDWVGHDDDWDLIRCIVGWNARLQLKQ